MLLILVLLIAAANATSPLPPKPICQDALEPLIPLECGPNSYYSRCPSTCSDLCPPTTCPCGIGEDCCRPRCVCNEGYLRNQRTGLCVKKNQCPSKCGKNEHLVIDSTICQKTCGNRIPYIEGPCKPYTGCVCDDGYVRPYDNATGTCIPVKDCPPIPRKCGLNEIPVSCRHKCPPQSCEISYTEYMCPPSECEPGCNCRENYLRNSSNICIPADDCPPRKPCSTKCRPTCAVPNPPDCPYNNPYNASDPCACKQGYILSKKGGKCIRVEECPVNVGCNGDPNAVVKECPLPCPSTCDRPNAIQCRKKCEPLGCECAVGYILSEYNGKCIVPDECPGGHPCGKNEDFVSCKVPCPSDYCPAEDILRYPVCELPSPCLSGCVCKHNYKRKSKMDPTCMLARNCPPVTCTRPNEEWNPCRPWCPKIDCEDAESFCSEPYQQICEPRCTCYEGYFRNITEVCVPLKQCPKRKP